MKQVNRSYLVKKNYTTQYVNNYTFMRGQVLKVFYVAKYKKKKRCYNFIGLCLYKDNWKFIMINTIGREKIKMTFALFSPAILQIFIIYMYKVFSSRVCNLNYKKKLLFKDDVSVVINRIYSGISSIDHDFIEFMRSRFLTRFRLKKINKKYRYNPHLQNWY